MSPRFCLFSVLAAAVLVGSSASSEPTVSLARSQSLITNTLLMKSYNNYQGSYPGEDLKKGIDIGEHWTLCVPSQDTLHLIAPDKKVINIYGDPLIADNLDGGDHPYGSFHDCHEWLVLVPNKLSVLVETISSPDNRFHGYIDKVIVHHFHYRSIRITGIHSGTPAWQPDNPNYLALEEHGKYNWSKHLVFNGEFLVDEEGNLPGPAGEERPFKGKQEPGQNPDEILDAVDGEAASRMHISLKDYQWARKYRRALMEQGSTDPTVAKEAKARLDGLRRDGEVRLAAIRVEMRQHEMVASK